MKAQSGMLLWIAKSPVRWGFKARAGQDGAGRWQQARADLPALLGACFGARGPSDPGAGLPG